jgi:hypothetical protein
MLVDLGAVEEAADASRKKEGRLRARSRCIMGVGAGALESGIDAPPTEAAARRKARTYCWCLSGGGGGRSGEAGVWSKAL